MSKLTENLDSLYNFLCLEYPKIAASLQPGLTREEIDNKVKKLQFSLPEEVYELYQWRNGIQGNIFFEWDFYAATDIDIVDAVITAHFYSLERALNTNFIRHTPFLIPLFFWYDNMVEGGFLYIDLKQEGSPIVYWNNIYLNDLEQEDFANTNLIYSSLTDLVSVIIECYEEALLSKSSEGLLIIDKDKFEQIHLKYKVH